MFFSLMRSLGLGKIFGIEIEIHWTFLILIIAITAALAFFEPEILFSTLTVFFLLFLSVFVHELMHSIVAIKKGINVSKIILLPIGGVSLMEDIPENPKDEFLISIAGPLFNFVVVAVILALVSLLKLPFPEDVLSIGIEKAILDYPLFALLWVNFVLGIFNLFVPALPLDGGRVFRALISMKYGYEKSTHIISKASTIISVILFIAGLLTGSILVMIVAVFIYLGSAQEDKIAAIKSVLKNEDLFQIINPNPVILTPAMPVYQALDLMLSQKKTRFLIFLGNNKFGSIEASDLTQLSQSQLSSPLRAIAAPVESISLSGKAGKAMEKFMTKGYSILPVMSDGQFIGSIELEDMEKLYQLSRLKRSIK